MGVCNCFTHKQSKENKIEINEFVLINDKAANVVSAVRKNPEDDFATFMESLPIKSESIKVSITLIIEITNEYGAI